MINWLLGIINELPFNALLKAKVEKLEEEKGFLENEVVGLQDELRKSKNELKRSNEENEKLQKHLDHFKFANLTEFDIEILKYIETSNTEVLISELPTIFNKTESVIRYSVDTLRTNSFILIDRATKRPESHKLTVTGAGRKFLFTNKHICDD